MFSFLELQVIVDVFVIVIVDVVMLCEVLACTSQDLAVSNQNDAVFETVCHWT